MLHLNIKRFCKLLFMLASILFLAILGLNLLNIGLRFFGESLRGTVEMTSYLGAATLGLCLPWVQFQKSHAYAGVFFTKLSPLLQNIINLSVIILGFALTSAFTIELYDLTIFVHEGMEVVDGWNIPSALFIFALCLGLGGQCLVIGLELLLLIQKLLISTD